LSGIFKILNVNNAVQFAIDMPRLRQGFGVQSNAYATAYATAYAKASAVEKSFGG
jgi:hypothetical protein